MYRLQGVWPQFATSDDRGAGQAQPERKSLFSLITGALLGSDGAKRR